MRSYMFDQIIFVHTSKITWVTFIWLFTIMCSYMFNQTIFTFTTKTTCVTFKRFFTSMCSYMPSQIRFVFTTKIVCVTFKRPLTSMCSYMPFQCVYIWWFIRTKFALILYFSFFPLMKSKTQKSMREQSLKIFWMHHLSVYIW